MASFHPWAVDVDFVKRSDVGQVGYFAALELERDVRIGRRHGTEVVTANRRLDHREHGPRDPIIDDIVDRAQPFEVDGLELFEPGRRNVRGWIQARDEEIDEAARKVGIE